MKKKNNILILIVLAVMAGKTGTVVAQGNLLINPVRVILDKMNQSENVTLSNTGNDSATYIISFVHYKMNPNGSFKQLAIEDSTMLFADSYVRYYPHRVTLAPHEVQNVKLIMRLPTTGSPSEMRTHLYFRADKKPQPAGLEKKSEGLSFNLTAIFGISIPVFVRSGIPQLKLELVNENLVHVNDSIAELRVSINRTGNISSYGNLKVSYLEDGNPVEIASINGIGIYTELGSRDCMLSIKTTKERPLTAGKLLITFSEDNKGKLKILAEKTLEIK